MRRLIGVMTIAALLATLVAAGLPGVATATATCSPTGFYRDGINLTAAQIGGSVTGALDAGGCDIGVYFNGANPGSVTDATIAHARYFGVVVDGGAGNVTINVTGSTVSDIGDSPFDGNQHGVAVYYYGYGTTGTVTGMVSGNTVSAYQKGGIVVSGTNAAVDVTDNMVTGLGPVPFIAQNGIQFGYGASGSATGNTISGNDYSGSGYVSAGLLLFDVAANAVSTSNNHYSGNQRNRVLVTTQACPSMYGGVYGSWDICILN